MMRPFQMIIGGNLVDGASEMGVINPATEQEIASCPRADLAQVHEAIAAAKGAFPGWAAVPIDERREAIGRICDELAAQAKEISCLLTAEQGKPLSDAMEELAGAAALGRMLVGLNLDDRVIGEDAGGQFIEQRYPLGVIGIIVPWNMPVVLMMVKAVSALLAGNTCVAKPAATTPLASLRVGEIFNRHLPAGVVNMITDANDLGGELTKHPDVAKIAFTGSTATGLKVMQSAASPLKRVTLELGGNDAAIVLDDADVKVTAKGLFNGAMINNGQICLAIKRAYVPTSLYDALFEELVALSAGAIVDDGSKQGTQFGPIQNKQQYDKILSMLDDAKQRGAKLSGGETRAGPGYFIRPGIVRDIDDDARLVKEEQFGPILPLLRYNDLEDAIRRANSSELGLGGTVWGTDIARAQEVASRMETGMVWINAHMNVNPFVAMGGAKQSGVGVELGQQGLEEYTQRRVLYVPNAA